MNHLKPYRWKQMFKGFEFKRTGFGERKLKREAEKAPLLALIPGELKTPEQYEADFKLSQKQWQLSLRKHQTRSWLKLRAWLRSTTVQNRERFFKRWHIYPHDPAYGLDLARRIEQEKQGNQ